MERRNFLSTGQDRVSEAARVQTQEVRRRIALASESPGVRRGGLRVRGDHELNPDLAPSTCTTPAAVLVPLVMHESGLTVLLTVRTAHLHDHAGQISFPGGRVEPDDPDTAAAAMRETEEELGIRRDRVELIGRLDTYHTRTGYEITPMVGLVKPPLVLAPDSFEVADVFEVPLSFILDPANHRREERMDRGAARQFWVLPYQGRYIWGATAGMLINLYEVLSNR
jgi:8-oxo-dGTP pyrophosphatase MutT (NUDIX family)